MSSGRYLCAQQILHRLRSRRRVAGRRGCGPVERKRPPAWAGEPAHGAVLTRELEFAALGVEPRRRDPREGEKRVDSHRRVKAGLGQVELTLLQKRVTQTLMGLGRSGSCARASRKHRADSSNCWRAAHRLPKLAWYRAGSFLRACSAFKPAGGFVISSALLKQLADIVARCRPAADRVTTRAGTHDMASSSRPWRRQTFPRLLIASVSSGATAKARRQSSSA